jgi:catechol 2,3-dioxygenase-like lactoylglutathione lyase family enzyme
MTSEPRVMLKRLGHIIYSHSDIDKARAFLEDFGMTLAGREGDKYYYRGYGDLPYVYVAEKAEGKGAFKGTAWEAESREELEKAARIPVRVPRCIVALPVDLTQSHPPGSF